MTWPLPQDFNEAVQNPAIAFSDSDLKNAQAVVGPSGLPLPRSGNFADVYQLRAANGKDWAVKCFTRPVTGLEQRYKKLDEALKKAGLPFTIGFAFLNEGVMVHGAWRPAVKMEWVDGLQLNQVVRTQAGSPKVLDALVQMWSRLCKKLREAGVAHADLQHGNVLLVSGSKPGSYGLKLIDYDGMFVPSLANTPSGESGHPNYQHPHRAAKQIYSPDLDRFPHLVIATALKGLAVLGPKLWEKYDTGDNVLFTEDDFKSPSTSALMKELWQSNNPALQSLVGHLAIACGRPIPQTPWLDQIAPEGIPVPLSAELMQTAAAALGMPVAVVPVQAEEYGVDLLGPTQSVLTAAFGGFDAESSETSDLPPRKRVREPLDEDDRRSRPRKKSMMLPLAIGGGVLALVIAVVAAVAMSGGDKKPDETAQKKDDEKEKERPKPQDKDKEKPKPPDVPVTPPKKDPIVPPKKDPVESDEFNFDPANVPELNLRWSELTTQNALQSRFTRDGQYVIARDGMLPSVRVFAERTGARLAGFTEGETTLVDFVSLPDGKVASWHVDQPFALVWNPATGKSTARIPVRTVASPAGSRIFDASPDGRFVAMGYQSKGPDSGKLSLFDTEGNKELVTLEVKTPRTRFTETHFIVGDADRVQFFKLPGGASDREVRLPQANPGSRVYALSADGTLALHNTRGNRLHLTKGEKTILSLAPRFIHPSGAISDDGRLVAAISPTDRNSGEASTHVEVLDLLSKKIVGRYLLGTGAVDVSSMAFAPDNSAMVISRSGRRIQVIDLPREVAAVVPKPKDPVTPDPMPKDPPVGPAADAQVKWTKEMSDRAAAFWFTPDGKLLVNRNNSSTIETFDAETGEAGVVYKGRSRYNLRNVVRMDDGRVFSEVMTGHVIPDNPVMFWDLKTGEELGPAIKPEWLPPPLDKSYIYNLMSPNGRYVFSARFGPAKPGMPGKLYELNEAPYRLSDTTDGKSILAASWQGGSATFTRDSKWLVIYDCSGKFIRMKPAEGREENTWTTPQGSTMAALVAGVNSDASVILFNGPLKDKPYGAYVVDAKTGKALLALPSGTRANWSGLAEDGKRVGVVVVESGPMFATYAVMVMDVESGRVVSRAKFDTSVNEVFSIRFSPDLKRFAVSDRSKIGFTLYEFKSGAVSVAPKPKDPPPMPKLVERGPVPEAADITKAETKLRGMLKDDYAKKLPSERKALATKLLDLAEDTADDPALRYVMFLDARDVSVEIFDAGMAMQAVEGILRHYRADADALRLATFEKIRDAAGNTTTLRTVTELALAASDTAMAADNHAVALKFAQTAASAAKRGNLPTATQDEAEGQVTKAQKAAEAFKPVADALARLQTNPADAEAAYVVGRHRCFVQGRWDDGLPLLAKGASGDVKLAAALDAAAPKAAPMDTRIADAWWQAAETSIDVEKSGARFRARHWYALALPALAGDARTQAETRLGFTIGGVDHRGGLIAEFTAKVPAILKGQKARLDSAIDFNAGEFKADGAGVATDLTVKWTGAIAPQRPGRYRFAVTATDPVIVRIDGRTVIDTSGKSAKRDALVVLPERPVPFSVEFKCINTDKHSVKLLWSIPGSESEEPVPAEVFSHEKKLESVLPKMP